MTTYFDELSRRVDKANLEEAIEIEAEVVATVQLATGDREFPADMRENIMGIIARDQMCPSYASGPEDPLANSAAIKYFNIVGTSKLIDALHGAFHTLGSQRVQTRFGVLLDDPADIVKLRDIHDTEGNQSESDCSQNCSS